MGKIIDTSRETISSYTKISQTPINMVGDNYYLSSLQDKINADWEFRYNRFSIEEEKPFASNQYQDIEVVIQTVRNDKGTKVSDDIRKLVFKDVLYDVKLGAKFRFGPHFGKDIPEEDKDIWLVTNKNSISPTAEAVVTRCNGTIGSLYKNSDGEMQVHYEPVICSTSLQSANLYYNDTIITPQAQVILTVQFNEYTKNYYLNQRFILGYNQVYKVKAINNFNSLSTYDPLAIGTIMLHVELDEKSPKDNFETRIAFNEDGEGTNTPVVTEPENADYNIKRILPTTLPTDLPSSDLEFVFKVYNGDSEVVCPINFSYELTNTELAENYISFEVLGDNNFKVRKIRTYNRGVLIINCVANRDVLGITEDLTYTFEMNLRGL